MIIVQFIQHEHLEKRIQVAGDDFKNDHINTNFKLDFFTLV